MSLKSLEDKWKSSLNEILEQLDQLQYEKMVVALDVIPRALKADKTRLELTQLLVQYYGTIKSIKTVTKILDEIPRRDAAVQEPLRLVHQELENYMKQNNKKTTASVKKIPTAEKKKSSASTVGQSKGKWMKSKSVDVAEPSCSTSVTSKRKFDEAEEIGVKMMKDDSAAQRSELKIQSPTNRDTLVHFRDPNKAVGVVQGVVQPQKTTKMQTQSLSFEMVPEQVPEETIKLVVVREVYKKKVYVFAEVRGSMVELEVTPQRLAVAFGLKKADPEFKNHLHQQLPAYVNVQLNGKIIVKIERFK